MSNAAVLSLMNMTDEQVEREVDLAMQTLFAADPYDLIMTIIALASKEILEVSGLKSDEEPSKAHQAAVFRVSAAMVLQEKARRESES